MAKAPRPIDGARSIAGRYRRFLRQLNELWEGYELLRAVFSVARPNIKAGTRVEFRPIPQPENIKVLSARDTFGVISRYEQITAPAQTLAQALALFELLLADIALRVYLDFPNDVYVSMGKSPDEQRDANLLEIILDSQDREEILERVAWGRIQSIGYGNLTRVLTKDSLRLRLGGHFDHSHDELLATLGEASARRNIWMHNDGKVDRRYLQLVATSTLRLGMRATISDDYLFAALTSMRTLGACVAYWAVRGYYHLEPGGRLAAIHKSTHTQPS